MSPFFTNALKFPPPPQAGVLFFSEIKWNQQLKLYLL